MDGETIDFCFFPLGRNDRSYEVRQIHPGKAETLAG